MAKKKQSEETIVDVQEVYTKTEMFIDRNRKLLTVILGGVALAFVIFFGYRYLYVIPKEKEAMESIWKAQLYFENDSLELALNGDDLYPGFEEISETYPGTNVGKLSHYYMGVIYRDRAEYEIALEHFLQADFEDDVVGIIAMGNAGDMYVELGELDQARDLYKKAVGAAKSSSSQSYSAPTYLYKLGIVQMELGMKAEARSSFEDVRDNYPDYSDWEKCVKYAAALSKS